MQPHQRAPVRFPVATVAAEPPSGDGSYKPETSGANLAVRPLFGANDVVVSKGIALIDFHANRADGHSAVVWYSPDERSTAGESGQAQHSRGLQQAIR
jgi:hypothetical protein